MDVISKSLKKIFKDRFELDMDRLETEFLDKKLLGSELGLAPRDLFCFFLMLRRNSELLFRRKKSLQVDSIPLIALLEL